MDNADLTHAISFHEGLFFCLCPNANQFIENRLPDIPALINANGAIVLGTDSLASNTQLSILEEMKMIKQHFPFIPTSSMLTWATSNGSRALSFQEKLGDFTKKKKPGIVLVEHLTDGEIGVHSSCRRYFEQVWEYGSLRVCCFKCIPILPYSHTFLILQSVLSTGSVLSEVKPGI
jgi:cytosine/adenosine deaminase-related metal-dependent hydrolase